VTQDPDAVPPQDPAGQGGGDARPQWPGPVPPEHARFAPPGAQREAMISGPPPARDEAAAPEPTMPLAGPVGPPPMGPPPGAYAGQQPLSPWGPPGGAPERTLVLGGAPAKPRQAGASPWIWPAVAALALVLGIAGGFVGAQLGDDDPATLSSEPADVGNTQAAPVKPADSSVVSVAEALLPSTVQVLGSSQGGTADATGSGFVLNDRGHVITNNHVVAGAAGSSGRIEVVDHDGNYHEARLVGRSAVYDIAVLEVPGARDLKPAALGNTEKLRVGEQVVAIGSPLGLSSTVTSGIVSALKRPVTTGDSADDTSYINAVQTDAAINPGNSGGPLVNMLGQVVGVNTAIATAGMGEGGNIGVGFAIPVEQVRVTARQIIKTGEARYPVIGASVNTRPDQGRGAPIESVTSGGPADQAGITGGDVITEVEGERVTDGIALIVAIRTHQPGETIALTVVRNGQSRTVRVELDGEVG